VGAAAPGRVTALLALLSAVMVGGADFLGGITSRRARPVVVAATSQVLGLSVAIPIALVWWADELRTEDVALSLASGIAVGVGFVFFYGAMAGGFISLAAPVAAVVGAMLPVAVGFVRGERPGAVAVAGVALALVAIAIVSIAPAPVAPGGGTDAAARTVVLGAAAGFCFGFFFLCFAGIDEDAGLAPLPIYRVASAAILIAVAVAMRVHVGEARPVARRALAISTLEVLATVPLLLALQRGPLVIAAVVASLYPVTTVILARGLLHERLSRRQLAGVALALVAVALVSTG
jgi:drug/metabolite transporter (DMT)-like permease